MPRLVSYLLSCSLEKQVVKKREDAGEKAQGCMKESEDEFSSFYIYSLRGRCEDTDGPFYLLWGF